MFKGGRGALFVLLLSQDSTGFLHITPHRGRLSTTQRENFASTVLPYPEDVCKLHPRLTPSIVRGESSQSEGVCLGGRWVSSTLPLTVFNVDDQPIILDGRILPGSFTRLKDIVVTRIHPRLVSKMNGTSSSLFLQASRDELWATSLIVCCRELDVVSRTFNLEHGEHSGATVSNLGNQGLLYFPHFPLTHIARRSFSRITSTFA